MLATVALGGFAGGWVGGYPHCLRGATGGMIGGLFGGFVSGTMAWVVSGQVEPLSFVLMAGGGMAGGSQAARDGGWMAAAIGILVGGLLSGISVGFASRLGLMARRAPKDPPNAKTEA